MTARLVSQRFRPAIFDHLGTTQYRQSTIVAQIKFWGCVFYLMVAAIPPAQAQVASCSGQFRIDRTLANGARWEMCWLQRVNEGVVLADVHYTPNRGIRRKVFGFAGIGQIHVSYDNNSARFHDVADYGLGATNLDNLTTDSCKGELRSTTYTNPDGVQVPVNAVCVDVDSRGYAYAAGGNRQRGQMLKVFSVSTIGKYSYIPTWHFNDDGSIESYIGATGKLQVTTEVDTGVDYDRGWLTKNNVNGKDTYAVSHTHHYYWRLDFDLNGKTTSTGQSLDNNDIVEEIELRPYDGNRRRQLVRTRLRTETARQINRNKMRSWRISDGAATNREGQSISYHIEPMDQGHRDLGPLTVDQPLGDLPAWQRNELWTQYDFFVSVAKDCERFATRNFGFTGNDSDSILGNDSCLPFGNVAEFVGIPEYPVEPTRTVKPAESLINQDIVTWYGASFYHLPRDEDDPYMHAHWTGLKITPRDWHEFNPNANGAAITLTPNTVNTGRYGYKYGASAYYTELEAKFADTGQDALIRVRGFDIDQLGEVDVLLNGRRVARLATTANNASGRVQQFFVPANRQIASNSLVFKQKRTGDRWGVTELEVVTLTSALVRPRINRRSNLEYGNKYNNRSTHPDAVQIAFNNSGGSHTIAMRGYDIDAPDEVTVFINGKSIGTLTVSANNKEGAIRSFALPQDKLRSGTNIVTVLQGTKGFKWGITDITLGDGTGPDVALTLGVTDKARYGNKYGDSAHPSRLRVRFDNPGQAVNLKVRGFDIDTATEVAIRVNGNAAGYLPPGRNNRLTAIHTVPIPQSSQVPGSNIVEFVQTTAGFKWGLRYLRIEPQ